jgi:uncharacterized MAPEG superfamily protein
MLLMLLVDLAAWVFAASALAQAAYLFVLAPRYFDVADPPDAGGRRQSTNAFVVYCAATALVLWALFTGRLAAWQDTPAALLGVAGAAFAAHVGYMVWMLAKVAPGSRPSSGPGPAADEEVNGDEPI